MQSKFFTTLVLGLIPLFTIVFVFPSITSAQQKRIYIASDDHTDLFWSADEATYRAAFLETLDYYLNQADQMQANPTAFQSRFSADGSYWMKAYQQNRTAAQFSRLMDRVRDGHISIPLNGLSVTYGAASAESIIRGMYYSGQIERQFNVSFPLGYSMEGITLPYGLSSIWAGSGGKYSWKGICGCATVIPNTSSNRNKEIYWWQGPDGNKILMKWFSMPNGNESVGGYAEARNPSSIVDFVDTNTAFKTRYPYNVIGVFGKGWDDLKTMSTEFVTVAQQKTNTNRQVIVSNEIDFFKDFEQTYGATLSSQGLSFGNEWDLDAALIAEQNARVKRSVEKLRSAEAIATVVSLVDPTFMNGRSAARDAAWNGYSLFWEHDLGSATGSYPAPRIAWQKQLATSVESYTDTLFTDASTRLGTYIAKSGANSRLFVFNPLSWNRNDVASIVYTGVTPVHVVNVATGQEVPSQINTIGTTKYLSILANNIPSVGYSSFEIIPGVGQVFPQAITVNGSTVNTPFYTAVLSGNGAMTSLIDKTRGNKEFAKQVNGKWLNDIGSTGGTLTVENIGPVSATVRADSTAGGNHTTRITFYTAIPRIDIQNDINQNFGNSMLTWSYGFNITTPVVNHEEIGAVIPAKTSANGGVYSTYQSRLDWLSANHFIDISDSSQGVTLSNADVSFMKLGNSTTSSLDTSTPQITMLGGGPAGAYGQVSLNQANDTHFLQRFSLIPHGVYDQTAAMKTSLEHQNPFVTGMISGSSPQYPESSYSLLTIADPSVLLWALKPAEEGIAQGIIARVWNMGSVSKQVALSFPNRTITSAKKTTHIETDSANASMANGSLSETVNGQQIATYRLFTQAASTTPQPSATPTPSCGIPGDLSCSGKVDSADLLILLGNFGKSGVGDINNSGKVDSADLLILLGNFGK